MGPAHTLVPAGKIAWQFISPGNDLCFMRMKFLWEDACHREGEAAELPPVSVVEVNA